MGQLQLKAKELEAALASLQVMTLRYQNRESREEDINRVRELELKVRDEIKLRKKAIEDMKYFRLELINREESYNKTFGRSPQVASGVPQQGRMNGGGPNAKTRVAGPGGPFGGPSGGASRTNKGEKSMGREAAAHAAQIVGSQGQAVNTGNFGLPPLSDSLDSQVYAASKTGGLRQGPGGRRHGSTSSAGSSGGYTPRSMSQPDDTMSDPGYEEADIREGGRERRRSRHSADVRMRT